MLKKHRQMIHMTVGIH